jgi:butyryl-CoA dehydrogenase
VSFIDRRDLAFWLYDWLGAEKLTAHPAYADHSRETFDAVLELSEQIATDLFANHYKKSDQVEPRLEDGRAKVIPEIKQAMAAYAEAGLFAASFAPELGGMGLPHVVDTASMAHFMAANIATAAYPMLTAANARVLAKYGTPAQIEAFARLEIEGKALGTMCLSEPQAGSSLADVATRAVADGDGAADDELGARYRLTGNKMWISGGDHDITETIIHLVLAKIPGPDGKLPAGTAGITLFIVPSVMADGTRNDISVAGLNHKMGYRGTTNCLLNFGEAGGAIGYRLGEAGQGLNIMFTMMNEARLFVGLGAAALAIRGYRQSLDYARERLQGREGKDPTSAPVPIIKHADVKRMLLAEKALAEGALSLILYCAHLMDRERVAQSEADRNRAASLLGLLTPVAKSWPSEFGLEANTHAIQVHGGYGYTRDFDVEQIYRDNRINPIHEGTHGIQAIDLVGRKIIRDKGAALSTLGQDIAATVARASGHDRLKTLAAGLEIVWSHFTDVAGSLIALNDPVRVLDNASPFLTAFGHLVVSWLWLDQAAAVAANPPADPAWAEGKFRACRYFIEIELPKVAPLLMTVASLNDVAATMPQDAF